jgi:hypothetical protein
MNAARSSVRAFLGLVLLACMFAAVTILPCNRYSRPAVPARPALGLWPVPAGCASSASRRCISRHVTRGKRTELVDEPHSACDGPLAGDC